MTPTPAFVGVAGVPAWLVAVGVAAVAVVATGTAVGAAGLPRDLRDRGALADCSTSALAVPLGLGWLVVAAAGGAYLAAPTVLDAGTWGPDATAFAFGLLSTLVCALAVGGVVVLRTARGAGPRLLALLSAAYPLAYAPAAVPHVVGVPVPGYVVVVAQAVPPLAAVPSVFVLPRWVRAGHDGADPATSRPDDAPEPDPDVADGAAAATGRDDAPGDAARGVRAAGAGDGDSGAGRALSDLPFLGERQVEALGAAGYETVADARAAAVGDLIAVFGVGRETADRIREAEPAEVAACDEGPDRTGRGASDPADDEGVGSADSTGTRPARADRPDATDRRPDVSARFVDNVDDVERATVTGAPDAGVLEVRVGLADGREGVALAADPADGRADVDTFVGRVRGWTQADAHDGVVEVLAWGTDPVPWVVRPADAVAFGDDDRPDALPEQVAVAAAVCEAVRHAGLYGTAHYHLSPAALYRRDGAVQVGDWGVADALGLRGPDAYAAPEQFDGGDLGTPTTVYRAGATLFWLFSGAAPYDADRDDLADAVRAGEAHRTDAVADVPADVADAVARAMDPDPERRYDSVHHLSLDVRGGAD